MDGWAGRSEPPPSRPNWWVSSLTSSLPRSTAKVRAAKQATSTIPIVMVGVIDPVAARAGRQPRPPRRQRHGADGHCRSWRWWGNVCSSSRKPCRRSPAWPSSTYSGAQPEPPLVGALAGSGAGARRDDQLYGVRDPEELEGAFAAMTKARTEALQWRRTPFGSATEDGSSISPHRAGCRPCTHAGICRSRGTHGL